MTPSTSARTRTSELMAQKREDIAYADEAVYSTDQAVAGSALHLLGPGQVGRREQPAGHSTFPDVVALAGKIAERSLGRGKDQFGIDAAFGAFKRVARREGPARLVALTALAEAVDAHLTSLQLARGTRADILQTVRWELAVVEDAPGAASSAALARIAARCRQFVEDWEARKANPSDAVGLVRAPSSRSELSAARTPSGIWSAWARRAWRPARTWICFRASTRRWSGRSRLRSSRASGADQNERACETR